MDYVLFTAGLLLLVGGAEMLVRGAARVAAALGISPLIVGLTVVAYGTSAPEVAVSVHAAAQGTGAIALGNIIGSNITNVLLILGIGALIAPLCVSTQLIRFDVPVMIAVSAFVLLLAASGSFGRIDGILLLGALVVYTAGLFYLGKREKQENNEARELVSGKQPQWLNWVFVLAGFALLVWGANWLVDSAVTIARRFGVSEFVIGVTIVALGTSLPEVATAVVASIRGQCDMAVGNVIGSNIFNLLGVLGCASVAAPSGITVPNAVLGFDLPVMLAVAIACLPIFFTKHEIARWEGGLFLGYYFAYCAYLLLASAQHDALPIFSMTMAVAVIPLTLITLAVVTWRAFEERRKQRMG